MPAQRRGGEGPAEDARTAAARAAEVSILSALFSLSVEMHNGKRGKGRDLVTLTARL